jgi:hypothetical protein
MDFRRVPFLACVAAAVAATVLPSRAQVRTFTDDQGRTTEAELVAVQGDHVVLRKDGTAMRWPVAKLSPADQLLVRAWKPAAGDHPRLAVRIWKRPGPSPEGEVSAPAESPSLPNIPGLRDVETRDDLTHYEVHVTNLDGVVARQLVLGYQLYVTEDSGEITVATGSAAVPDIPPRERATVFTRAMTATRTKTSSLEISVNPFGGVATGRDVKRGRDRFGGAWVRVFAADGTPLAEARDLSPSVEAKAPAWIAPTDAALPLLDGGLDRLGPAVKRLREAAEALRKGPPPPPLPR